MSEKKTEEQLRHDIRREFSYSEEKHKDKIDKVLELKKDRFTATQSKNKGKEEIERLGGVIKKAGIDPKTGEKISKEPKGNDSKEDYSLQDIRALSKIHDDDVDRVTKFARGEKVSIAEAIKDKDLQAILKNREEERKTANATNTDKTRRGSSKISGETLVQKAQSKGEIPESDGDLTRMVKARKGLK